MFSLTLSVEPWNTYFLLKHPKTLVWILLQQKVGLLKLRLKLNKDKADVLHFFKKRNSGGKKIIFLCLQSYSDVFSKSKTVSATTWQKKARCAAPAAALHTRWGTPPVFGNMSSESSEKGSFRAVLGMCQMQIQGRKDMSE